MYLAIQKLKESKPIDFTLEILRQRKLYFKNFEHQLDTLPYGNCSLRKPEIATILQDKLHEFDGNILDLIAYSIMPNHVHVLFDTSRQLIDEHNFILDEVPESYIQLHDILKKIKGSTLYLANKCLGKRGMFWAKDSYDHYVRDEEELFNIIRYIIINPVKTGLVKNWKDYPYTYLRQEFT